MVTLVRLQRQLLQRLELLLLQLLHLRRKHSLRRGRRVDARRLDRNDAVASVLQEVLGVDADDTRLVRLRHIREDRIHHAHQHAVLERVTRVLDDRNNIRTRFRHIDQVTTGTVRELHCVHQTLLPVRMGRYETQVPPDPTRVTPSFPKPLPGTAPCCRDP